MAGVAASLVMCERLGASHEPFTKARLVSRVQLADHVTLDAVDDAPRPGDDTPSFVRCMNFKDSAVAGSRPPRDQTLPCEHEQDLVRRLLGEHAGPAEFGGRQPRTAHDHVERRVLRAGDAQGCKLAVDYRTQRRMRLTKQEGHVAVGSAKSVTNLDLPRHSAMLLYRTLFTKHGASELLDLDMFTGSC